MSRPAPLAYLATPYSKYPNGIREAFEEACRISARLLLAGTKVFSPIVHMHSVKLIGGISFASHEEDHAFWMQADEAMMRVCDVLIVVHMNSWEISKGIATEVAYFEKAGRPIFDLDPDTLVMTRRSEPKSTRLTLHPARPRPELDRRIAEANARFDALTPEQQREHRLAQRKSWVIGETMLAHPEMTREEAERLYDWVSQ